MSCCIYVIIKGQIAIRLNITEKMKVCTKEEIKLCKMKTFHFKLNFNFAKLTIIFRKNNCVIRILHIFQYNKLCYSFYRKARFSFIQQMHIS